MGALTDGEGSQGIPFGTLLKIHFFMMNFPAIFPPKIPFRDMSKIHCLLLLALLTLQQCSAPGTTPTVADATNGPPPTFVTGVWMDKWLVDRLKAREFDSAWSSLRNYTQFVTSYNGDNQPFWSALVPDDVAALQYKAGRWYDGEVPLIEFIFEDGDTLAKYRFKALGYEEAGVGEFRMYQKVLHQDDGVDGGPVLDDWIYRQLYFPGQYLASPPAGKSFFVELTAEGDVIGWQDFNTYGLDLGNSLPLLYLHSRDTVATFAMEATPTGFLLFDVPNAEELDGADQEIVKGALALAFVRE